MISSYLVCKAVVRFEIYSFLWQYWTKIFVIGLRLVVNNWRELAISISSLLNSLIFQIIEHSYIFFFSVEGTYHCRIHSFGLNVIVNSYCCICLVFSYCDSSPRFLYQIYSQLILPIPSQLEHLRTPEETDTTDQSVPIPPSTLTSVSAAVKSGETQADANRQRLDILGFLVRFFKNLWLQVTAVSKHKFCLPICYSSWLVTAQRVSILCDESYKCTSTIRRLTGLICLAWSWSGKGSSGVCIWTLLQQLLTDWVISTKFGF